MNAELLNAVNEAHPELLEKVAQAIFVLEHIDQDFAAELTAQIDDITEYTTEKMAADASVGVSGWGGAVAGNVLGGLLGSVATDLYDAAKRGLTKGMNYKRIMEFNPELRQQFDEAQLKRAYGTFHRFAPEFTADPNLGGQILRSMAELPDNQHVVIKDLLGSRKNLRDVKGGQFKPSNTPYVSADTSLALEGKREEMRSAAEKLRFNSDVDQAARIYGIPRERAEVVVERRKDIRKK